LLKKECLLTKLAHLNAVKEHWVLRDSMKKLKEKCGYKSEENIDAVNTSLFNLPLSSVVAAANVR